MKLVLAPIWIGGFALVTLAMFLNVLSDHGSPPPPEIKWIFLGATLVGSALIHATCVRLKCVALDGENLVISNYVNEIVVPLTELESVSENVWINTHPITLVFARDTLFGRRVVFMPKTRMFAFFSSHPVVDELRQAAERARRRR